MADATSQIDHAGAGGGLGLDLFRLLLDEGSLPFLLRRELHDTPHDTENPLAACLNLFGNFLAGKQVREPGPSPC